MTEDFDTSIAQMLTARDPAQFDAFTALVGRAIVAAMPELERRVGAYRQNLGDYFDAEDVISRGVEDALSLLMDDYLGRSTRFRFDPSYGLTFKHFLMRVVGRPGGGAVSGRAGDEFTRALRRSQRHVPLEPLISLLAAPEPEIVDPTIDALSKTLKALPALEQFVLRARFGLHGQRQLDADGIDVLCREVGLPSPSRRKLRERAQQQGTVRRSATLRMNEIAALLDVSTKQVNTIKNRAFGRLRTGLRTETRIVSA